MHSTRSQDSGVKGRAGPERVVLEGCLKEVKLKENSGVRESSQEGITGGHEP